MTLRYCMSMGSPNLSISDRKAGVCGGWGGKGRERGRRHLLLTSWDVQRQKIHSSRSPWPILKIFSKFGVLKATSMFDAMREMWMITNGFVRQPYK